MSRVTAISPEYRDLVGALYGDAVDAEALWQIAKMSPDAADVHAPGALRALPVRRRRTVGKRKAITPQERQERVERNVARVSNAVGLTAGAAAIGTTARDPRLKDGGRVARGIYRAGERMPKPIERATRHVSPRTAAALAGGAFALQAGNVVGDVVTSRVLGRKPVEKGFTDAKLVQGSLKRLRTVSSALVPKAIKTTPPPRAAASGQASAAYGPRQQQAVSRGKAAKQDWNQFVGTKTGKATLATGGGLVALKAVRSRGNAGYPAEDVVWKGSFSKFDDDKRLAFGWASVVEVNGKPVVDRQGDYIAIDDIEDAAYVYVEKSRVGGDMHRRVNGKDLSGEDRPHHAADLVESMVFTPEKIAKLGLPSDFPVGWWVGFRYHDDEVWKGFKDGTRTGFSIHGKGIRKDVDFDELLGA